MAKVSHIQQTREKRAQRSGGKDRQDGFQPCSPDMTICGDCQDNRSKNKCPRLKEWQQKNKS